MCFVLRSRPVSPCACSAAGAPPRVSRVHLYFFRLRVVPRRCRRGVGRRARLRGKGLPIFCHLSCHDATTHHTMLEDFRSPQQVHPLAVPSRTGIPLKTWGESSGCPRPTNLFTSFTRLVSQQASPPASIRIPAVRRSAAATQGMPTTGDLLRDFETGDVSVDTLPNTPLLLSNISSPSCQAVAIATPCCEHKRILAVRRSLAAALGTPTCYDRRPPLPFGTWSRVCQFTPKPTSPSGQRFTSFRQAVAIATVCCQQRRIHADRCSCTIQHLEPCQGAQLVAARG